MIMQAHVGSFRAMLSDSEGTNQLVDVIRYVPHHLLCKPWTSYLSSCAHACWNDLVGR